MRTLRHRDAHVPGLLVAEAEAVPAQLELDRIPQRRAADHLHVRPVAETHLQQSSADFRIAADGDDAAAAADAKLIKVAGPRIAAVVACGKGTCFLHPSRIRRSD